jgi:hypothetical protein
MKEIINIVQQTSHLSHPHRNMTKKCTYRLFELHGLVHLAGETVDQETLLARGEHGVLEEGDGDLHGDDSALADISLDQLTVLRARALLLLAKKITS